MDIETYGLLKGKLERADEAAQAAQNAAEEATEAKDAIYHDKNFLLSVNEDSSLSLSYNTETED